MCVCTLVRHDHMWCMGLETKDTHASVCSSLTNGRWNKSGPYSLSFTFPLSLSCSPLRISISRTHTQITHRSLSCWITMFAEPCRTGKEQTSFIVREVLVRQNKKILQQFCGTSKRKTPRLCVCVCERESISMLETCSCLLRVSECVFLCQQKWA